MYCDCLIFWRDFKRLCCSIIVWKGILLYFQNCSVIFVGVVATLILSKNEFVVKIIIALYMVLPFIDSPCVYSESSSSWLASTRRFFFFFFFIIGYTTIVSRGLRHLERYLLWCLLQLFINCYWHNNDWCFLYYWLWFR